MKMIKMKMNKLFMAIFVSILMAGIASASSPISVSSITPTTVFQNSNSVFSSSISDTATNATLTNAVWFWNGYQIANNTISGASVTATQAYTPTEAGYFPMEVIALDNQSNIANTTTVITVTGNVTQALTYSFPITYTWNNGQVYIIQGASNQNCGLLVFNTIYKNGNYTQSTLLPADQAIVIMRAYSDQLLQVPPSVFICPVVFQEAQALTATTTTTTNPTTESGEIIVGVIVLAIIAGVYLKYIKK